jgi:hypothetical protein
MTLRVVAFARLADGDSIEDYRAWSLERVRPVMRAMESVIAFDDYEVAGSMDGEKLDYDLCEVIAVTDFDRFERDNATGDGLDLAKEWRERLDSWSVCYLRDLAE